MVCLIFLLGQRSHQDASHLALKLLQNQIILLLPQILDKSIFDSFQSISFHFDSFAVTEEKVTL